MNSLQAKSKKGKLALVCMETDRVIELDQKQAAWFKPYLDRYIETGSIDGTAAHFELDADEMAEWQGDLG